MTAKLARVALMARLAFAGALAASPALAQSDEFFKGRTITLLIGGTAGGGLDNAARIMARHMGRQVAGNPAITPQLMPGAGGIRVLDFLAGSAPKDGTTIAAIPSGPILEPLIGGRKAAYSMTDFVSIGAVIKDFSLCVAWHASGFRTIDDARAREMTVAGTGAASTTDIYPVVLNAALGTRFKVITGYLGTQETAMAVERGETHGRCGWSWSSLKGTRPQWLRDRQVNLLMQMGAAKSPEHPDVPFVLDLARTPEDRQMLSLLFTPLALSHAFLAPPGLSAQRAADLRRAFLATLGDDEVKKEVAAQLGEPASPTSGEDMQTLIVGMYGTPEAVVQRLRDALKK